LSFASSRSNRSDDRRRRHTAEGGDGKDAADLLATNATKTRKHEEDLILFRAFVISWLSTFN